MIPSYLKDIGKEIHSNKESTKIKIICTCGCEEFKLFKKKKSKEYIKLEKEYEKQFIKEFGRGFEMQSDLNGQVFIIKRNIFGKIVKKIEVKKLDIPLFKNFISAKCSSCCREYILFDENIHGYDAIIEKNQGGTIVESKQYSDESQKIELIVYYNDDNEEENINDLSVAFGRIKIIKITNNKKITYCDFECE